MSWQKIVIVIVGLLLVLIAWLGRYTFVAEGAAGHAYRLDRWTGEIVWVQGEDGGIVPFRK